MKADQKQDRRRGVAWTPRPNGRAREACPCDGNRQPPDLHRDESAATTLEWALLLAAIGLPSYVIIQLAIDALVGHYRMMTMINSLPFP